MELGFPIRPHPPKKERNKDRRRKRSSFFLSRLPSKLSPLIRALLAGGEQRFASEAKSGGEKREGGGEWHGRMGFQFLASSPQSNGYGLQ